MRCCTCSPGANVLSQIWPLESSWSSLFVWLSCFPFPSPTYLFNVPQYAVSVNVGVPGGDAFITCQHLKGRGLACSIEAQEAEALAFPHSQRQPVNSQQILPAAVHLRRREVPRSHLTETNSSPSDKGKKKTPALRTLLSSCSMRGLPIIDSTIGWHSRTLFLSSATSLSSGSSAASSSRGN